MGPGLAGFTASGRARTSLVPSLCSVVSMSNPMSRLFRDIRRVISVLVRLANHVITVLILCTIYYIFMSSIKDSGVSVLGMS